MRIRGGQTTSARRALRSRSIRSGNTDFVRRAAGARPTLLDLARKLRLNEMLCVSTEQCAIKSDYTRQRMLSGEIRAMATDEANHRRGSSRAGVDTFQHGADVAP
jgi:hypothetical protein